MTPRILTWDLLLLYRKSLIGLRKVGNDCDRPAATDASLLCTAMLLFTSRLP